VGCNFRTADCMGGFFLDVTLCAVLDWPNIGVLYNVLSLTHSLTLNLTLSLSLSNSSSFMSLRPIFRLWSSLSRFYDHIPVPNSVERLWTSDQSDARQHTTVTRGTYPWSCGIRIPSRSNRAAADPSPKTAWPLVSALHSKFRNIQLTVPARHARVTLRRRKQNVTPKRSVCLYVTFPSTAILMVLSRLSLGLVKIGYFALGLTVQCCSGNSCSGRWLLIHRGDCSISTCCTVSSELFSLLSASLNIQPNLNRYPRFRTNMNILMGLACCSLVHIMYSAL